MTVNLNNMMPNEHLRELCVAGLAKRYENSPLFETALLRLGDELGVIAKIGIANEFLKIVNLFRFVNEQGIYSTARGSFAGSMVSYSLNFSLVCPLEFDLLFERFLHESRSAPPFVEFDFDAERFDEVRDYLSPQELADTTSLPLSIHGSQQLTILSRTINIIQKRSGCHVDPYLFPLDDEDTYDLLKQGAITETPLFEDKGMRELLMRIKPEHFRDIIAAIALYRPGPIELGMVDQYIDVKHNRRQAIYLHPAIQEFLEETNGVMIYQEQMMRILNRLGNISLADSYEYIKTICKKQREKIVHYRNDFIEGTGANGLDKKQAAEVFEEIEKFAQYGFCKSHSTAYARVLYMLTYIKAHYPKEFTAAQNAA